MDRAWFAAVTAFPASLHGFNDLILHNCLLQLPQQGLCVVKEQAQVLSAKIVGRTAKANDIAPPSFSIVKRRLDKNTYIHGGSRLVLKLLPYHADHQVLPTPERFHDADAPGSKTLDRMAKSGGLSVKWAASWGRTC